MFLSGNTATAQLISLYLCTFPLAVRLTQARRWFLIFNVVSTNKENDQWVETAGQTQLTGRFVMIMEQKYTWLFNIRDESSWGKSILNTTGRAHKHVFTQSVQRDHSEKKRKSLKSGNVRTWVSPFKRASIMRSPVWGQTRSAVERFQTRRNVYLAAEETEVSICFGLKAHFRVERYNC